MTKQEYAEYEASVARFFESEGISNLSMCSDYCYDCDTSDICEDCARCKSCGSDNTTDAVELWFSHDACDCCKRSLGGYRFPWSGYNRMDNQVYHYAVCPDCVYYAEYGQLDDTTMMDMED